MPFAARHSPYRVLPALLVAVVGLTGAGRAAGERLRDQLDLDLYAALLDEYTRSADDVTGTRVAYARLRDEPRWQRLLTGLRASHPQALTRDASLAFWINAYNILAIETVRANFPLESIKDVGSFWSPVWDHSAGEIGGREVTLGGIEHEILRPLGDPRIHAAIVCASTSCPSLAREPYRAERIDEQLDATVRHWLASPDKGLRIDRAARAVRISKIFDWFEEDFERVGGVLGFVAAHVPDADAAWLRTHRGAISVDHFGYDWTVNSDPPRR